MPGLSELSLRGRRVLVRIDAVFAAMRQISASQVVFGNLDNGVDWLGQLVDDQYYGAIDAGWPGVC